MAYKRFEDNSAYMEAREDCVVIGQKNYWGTKTISEITVFYKDVTSVLYRAPRSLSMGYIEIKCVGNTYDPELVISGRGEDPYCVTILSKKQATEAEAFKQYIEDQVQNAKNKKSNSIVNRVNTTASTATSISDSAVDELLKYKKLLDAGVISQAEFNDKKRQLLGI